MDPRETITIVAGPCAVESYEQTMEMAYKISLVRDVAQPFGIDFKYRGGAWKPRTQYQNNGTRVFEGVGEVGLKWLADAANTYELPIVSEIMSETDLKYFFHYLEPERDWLQIGARDSQAYALLWTVGGTPFNVFLKNPLHGVKVEEAVGSLQRFRKNREKVYCTRGQERPISPDGVGTEAYSRFIDELSNNSDHHPDSRYLNNIGAIRRLIQHPYFVENGIILCHDPSHTWGGKNDLMRRKISEYAIKAITGEYAKATTEEGGRNRYNWIMVEVNDKSASAKCDGPQALLTTTRNVDWSQTNAGQGPGVKPNAGREPGVMPLTLVDITETLIDYQAKRMGTELYDERVISAKKQLQEVSWDTTSQ